MRLLARTWISAARVRRRFSRFQAPRAELIRRFAPGCTFADIGCMWNVDGEIAFLAEACGSTAVTGLDLMDATPRYAAEHARRSSSVRFVRGDLHDPAVMAAVGSHDVVWCSGVLYHAPNPLLTLERLHSITAQTLILSTETIPDIPGVAQSCVFFPGLADIDRRVYARARPGVALGVTTPFKRDQSYGAWWWGISASALTGMLHATGFEVLDQYADPLHATVVCRPTAVFAGG